MADSRRQQIVAALLTRMQGILVANTFETNAGQHVFEWPAVPLDEEQGELPAIVVRDGDCIVEREANMADVHHLQVDIECVGQGTEAAAEVRKIMGDVIEAISFDLTFGGLAIDTNLTGHNMRQISQEDRKLGGGELTFLIEYRTTHMDPF